MFKAQIIGNLGADAQVKSINGIDYISFDLAHSFKINEQERAIWVSCLARGFSKVLPYLTRGSKVYVCGDLSGRIYDSSYYHCKMIGYSVFVDTLQLCSSKSDVNANGASSPGVSDTSNPGDSNASNDGQKSDSNLLL